MIQRAIAIATEHRREAVNTVCLLYALIESDDGVAADILAGYGSSAAMITAEVKKAL
jgi:hypothetical protein